MGSQVLSHIPQVPGFQHLSAPPCSAMRYAVQSLRATLHDEDAAVLGATVGNSCFMHSLVVESCGYLSSQTPHVQCRHLGTDTQTEHLSNQISPVFLRLSPMTPDIMTTNVSCYGDPISVCEMGAKVQLCSSKVLVVRYWCWPLTLRSISINRERMAY